MLGVRSKGQTARCFNFLLIVTCYFLFAPLLLVAFKS